MTDRAARLARVALVVAVLLGGVASAPGASAQTLDTIADTQINPDDVSLNVDVRSDGSAAWTVEYRVRLDDDNTTEAFLSLRDDIRNNETRYASQFGQRMSSTAAAAENATGREMRIENVSATATRQQLPQDYGIVTYTFVWTNFAAVDGGEIRAGDALAGFFLDEETSLQFSWPEGYALDAAQPQPDDTRLGSRIVVWTGPVDFGPNEPALVVAEQPPDGGTETMTGGDGATDGGSDGGLASLALVALALVVAAGVGGWIVSTRRGPSSSDAAAAGGSDTAATESAGPDSGPSESGTDSTAHAGASGDAAGAVDTASADAADSATGSDSAAEDDTDSAAAGEDVDPRGPDDATSPADSGGFAAASSGAGAGAPGDDGPSAEDRPWEDELLSNEERVLALVEHEGGRMKQQEVAQTLEWTDAKTSQVVRKMRDEDKLDAFRLGRENVLVLPGEEFGPSDP
ncbi:DUF7345 domain-containing protein [Halobellus sp. GM3]|uniref:DUF7345 domain-containing protein n=1 Tax=Halobellus sp. GM3 TaxID=3458410 RepID=UPI00403E31B7